MPLSARVAFAFENLAVLSLGNRLRYARFNCQRAAFEVEAIRYGMNPLCRLGDTCVRRSNLAVLGADWQAGERVCIHRSSTVQC